MIIYIGYDSNQHEAYEVCKASIERYTHRHEIRPLVKQELEKRKDITGDRTKMKAQSLLLHGF